MCSGKPNTAPAGPCPGSCAELRADDGILKVMGRRGRRQRGLGGSVMPVVRFLVFSAVSLVGCSVPEGLLEQQRCPCIDGYTCDVSGVCVAEAETADCGCGTPMGCTPLRQVAFGSGFAFYLRGDGALFSAGQHDLGRLGIGSVAEDRLRPQRIEGSWREVVAGGNHACAIAEQGELYCWGGNNDGAAGLGESSGSAVPAFVHAGPFDACSWTSSPAQKKKRRSSCAVS